MRVWEFLSKQSDVPGWKVATMAGIAGLSNAVLLVIVNSAAHAADDENGVPLQMFILFVISITLYVLTQRYILRISSIEVEKIIDRLRVRLADKIRRTDLQSLEGLGRADIYASVNRETLTVSQATAPLIIGVQGSILVLFSLFYIYSISQTAFLFTLGIVGLGISVHFGRRKELARDIHASTEKENQFFDALTHLLEGFKEVKLHDGRGEDLFNDMTAISTEAADLKARTGARFADYYIFSQVSFYVLIGALVFAMPLFTEISPEQITRVTAAILFVIGPLTMVVGCIPVLTNANNSVQNIVELEDHLDRMRKAAESRENGDFESLADFRSIHLDDITFKYKDEEGNPIFTVGPIDLKIERGETIFIVGGNGSGKSTFLKMLTSLYYPMSGVIRVDGASIDMLGYRSYRNLFSAIFSDYHLFDRLYGMSTVDKRKVYDMLQLMQLDKKTTFLDGRFENQDLSTGQRKRLALIISLLEDKPIYIFDEWAADQDPAFRQFFYTHLLGELKKRGKTVIAATHDDRYFHLADRVMKMELGQLMAIQEKGEPV